MSVRLSMRAAIPTPEPPPVTAMDIPGFFSMKASASLWTKLTSVSEPLIWMETVSVSFLAHPAITTSTKAQVIAAVAKHFIAFSFLGKLSKCRLNQSYIVLDVYVIHENWFESESVQNEPYSKMGEHSNFSKGCGVWSFRFALTTLLTLNHIQFGSGKNTTLPISFFHDITVSMLL